jgi:hypothetical protein
MNISAYLRQNNLKQKTFMLIAGALAAEQRTIVAHSASYGSSRPQIFQAPAGATENHVSTTHFFRPVRGFNYFGNRSHGCHRGLLSRATPWLTKTKLLRDFNLWRTHSPIC